MERWIADHNTMVRHDTREQAFSTDPIGHGRVW